MRQKERERGETNDSVLAKFPRSLVFVDLLSEKSQNGATRIDGCDIKKRTNEWMKEYGGDMYNRGNKCNSLVALTCRYGAQMRLWMSLHNRFIQTWGKTC